MLFREVKCECICRRVEDNNHKECCRCAKDPMVELCTWCIIEEQVDQDKLHNALTVIENDLTDKAKNEDTHQSLAVKHYQSLMSRERYRSDK